MGSKSAASIYKLKPLNTHTNYLWIKVRDVNELNPGPHTCIHPTTGLQYITMFNQWTFRDSLATMDQNSEVLPLIITTINKATHPQIHLKGLSPLDNRPMFSFGFKSGHQDCQTGWQQGWPLGWDPLPFLWFSLLSLTTYLPHLKPLSNHRLETQDLVTSVCVCTFT